MGEDEEGVRGWDEAVSVATGKSEGRGYAMNEVYENGRVSKSGS